MRKNKSFLALSALGVIALILMVAAGVLLSGQRAVSPSVQMDMCWTLPDRMMTRWK